MITVEDYFMGQREKFPLALSPDIEREAARTVVLANKLLEMAKEAGVELTKLHPENHSLVSSGWRPPAVNAATPHAATNSKHMTGQAIDIFDPDRLLCNWVDTASGLGALSEIGLWIEDVHYTGSWLHCQTIPPNSGKRSFIP